MIEMLLFKAIRIRYPGPPSKRVNDNLTYPARAVVGAVRSGRGPEVGVLGAEAVEGLELPGVCVVAFGVCGQGRVPVPVSPPNRLVLSGGDQLFFAVFADGFQQAVPHLAVA